MFFITTPATSANLGAGFDCLGLALELRNEFLINPRGIGRVRISGIGAGASVLKRDNFFMQIFTRQLERYGRNSGKIDVHMHNRIALGRGMGSSSSVIIAALAAAAAVAEREICPDELLAQSMEYEPHTDNTAPCLLGGFCISAAGTNALQFAPPAGVRAIIAVPKTRVSTAASRAALAEQISRADAVGNLGKCAITAAALASGRPELLRFSWGDSLHQRARMLPLLGIYQQIFAALIGCGAADAEQIAQHFGEEFIPQPPCGQKAVTGKKSSSENPAENPADCRAYFCALSGSGSSFLTLAPAAAADRIARALSTISELECVHDLALAATGLSVQRR